MTHLHTQQNSEHHHIIVNMKSMLTYLAFIILSLATWEYGTGQLPMTAFRGKVTHFGMSGNLLRADLNKTFA